MQRADRLLASWSCTPVLLLSDYVFATGHRFVICLALRRMDNAALEAHGFKAPREVHETAVTRRSSRATCKGGGTSGYFTDHGDLDLRCGLARLSMTPGSEKESLFLSSCFSCSAELVTLL